MPAWLEAATRAPVVIPEHPGHYPTREEIVRTARHSLVVDLREKKGLSFGKIAKRVGLSKTRVFEIYSVTTGGAHVKVSDRRALVDASIRAALDSMAPFVLTILQDEENPPKPDKDMVANYWRGLDRLSKLWGLDAPKQSESVSTVVHADAEPMAGEKSAREFLTELAVWARATKAINVNGYEPALPMRIAGRPAASPPQSTNGGDGIFPRTKWSLVVGAAVVEP